MVDVWTDLSKTYDLEQNGAETNPLDLPDPTDPVTSSSYKHGHQPNLDAVDLPALPDSSTHASSSLSSESIYEVAKISGKPAHAEKQGLFSVLKNKVAMTIGYIGVAAIAEKTGVLETSTAVSIGVLGSLGIVGAGIAKLHDKHVHRKEAQTRRALRQASPKLRAALDDAKVRRTDYAQRYFPVEDSDTSEDEAYYARKVNPQYQTLNKSVASLERTARLQTGKTVAGDTLVYQLSSLKRKSPRHVQAVNVEDIVANNRSKRIKIAAATLVSVIALSALSAPSDTSTKPTNKQKIAEHMTTGTQQASKDQAISDLIKVGTARARELHHDVKTPAEREQLYANTIRLAVRLEREHS